MKLALLAGSCLLVSMPAYAEIPVIDFSSIAQQIATYGIQTQQLATEAKIWATDNLAWLESVKAYALQGQQYAVMGEELVNFVHAPNLGEAMGILNMAGLGNSLPVNPYSAMSLLNGYSSVGSGGFSVASIPGILGQVAGLSSTAYASFHVYTPTDHGWASRALEANGNAIAGTQGAALAAYSDYQTHAKALQALRDRAAVTTDMKASADLQAQIAIETAWTQNTAGQMHALAVQADAQKAATLQRDHETLVQGIDAWIAAQGQGATTTPSL
jgi:hypothetical protein